jgi:hypothetical protein
MICEAQVLADNPRVADVRVLVGIASYGTRNDGFLARLIKQYLSMRFQVDILIFLRSRMPRARWPRMRCRASSGPNGTPTAP